MPLNNLKTTLITVFLCFLAIPGLDSSGDSPDPVMAPKCRKSCRYKGKYSKASIVGQSNAQVGDLVRCPVSGVVFRVKKDSVSVAYKGERYYVCCHGCAQRFKENPTKFI